MQAAAYHLERASIQAGRSDPRRALAAEDQFAPGESSQYSAQRGQYLKVVQWKTL